VSESNDLLNDSVLSFFSVESDIEQNINIPSSNLDFEFFNESNDLSFVSCNDGSISEIGREDIDNLRVGFWNVHGLISKLQIATTFFLFLNEFDIFFLVETWIKADFDVFCFNSKLSNFNLNWIFATQKAARGRAMGGMLMGCRKSIKNNWKWENMGDLGYCRHLRTGFLIIPAYLPPFSWEDAFSKYYDFFNKFEFNNILLLGDVNARFGDLDNLNEDLFPGVHKRKAKDLVVNHRGKKILELCQDFELLIINGRGFSDNIGNFTFLNANGQSTIDVAIISQNIFDMILDFKILSRMESDHFPLSIVLKRLDLNNVRVETCHPLVTRLNWNLQDIDIYNADMEKKLEVIDFENIPVNEAIEKIVDCINTVAVVKTAVKFYEKPWFDSECLLARKKFHLALKKYEKCSDTNNHEQVCVLKKTFFRLCKQKKILYRDTLINEFDQISEPAVFWGAVGRIKKTEMCFAESIGADEWFSYFKNLLNPDIDFHYFSSVDNLVENGDLDRNFGLIELKNAVNRLKNDKAPGMDGIPGEFFKNLIDDNLLVLLGLFNRIFRGEAFPDNFIKAIIFPLFKKGDLAVISNFRGISFLSAFYKIYTQLLLARLQYFVFNNNILFENQAGFRAGYSTHDHIFTLSAIIEDQLLKTGGKVFGFFVDFAAAFDTVNRNSLIYKLYAYGFSTKCVEAIKAIYAETKARVWTKKGYTDEFGTTCGVRQGCLLSPLLFTIYINDLVDEIDVGGFCYNGVWIRLLMYADDIVFLAPNPTILQEMINKLENYCEKWDLRVNLNKSKIMVFRKGGKLSRLCKWEYKGREIEVVKTYKYLGINMTNSGKFNGHIELQLAVAKSGLNSVYKGVFGLQSKNVNSYFRLFDAVSRSVLCYAAQVWGGLKFDDVEKLQRFFIKKLFRLPYNTPNYMLLLETGRDSLFLFTLKLHWVFLSHTLQLADNRFSKIMFTIGVVNEHKWLRVIKENAIAYGNWDKFINFLDFSRVDPAMAELYNYMIIKDREGLMDKVILGQFHPHYKEIKLGWGREEFLGLGLSLQEMRFILLARLEMLPLNWKPWFAENDYKCTICNLKKDENVVHFIFECPMYKEFRVKVFGMEKIDMAILDILKGKCGWKKLAVYVNLALQYRTLIINEFDN